MYLRVYCEQACRVLNVYRAGKMRSKFYLRIVDDNCALPCYYTASSGNFLPTFRDNLSVPFQVTP